MIESMSKVSLLFFFFFKSVLRPGIQGVGAISYVPCKSGFNDVQHFSPFLYPYLTNIDVDLLNWSVCVCVCVCNHGYLAHVRFGPLNIKELFSFLREVVQLYSGVTLVSLYVPVSKCLAEFPLLVPLVLAGCYECPCAPIAKQQFCCRPNKLLLRKAHGIFIRFY